MNLLLRGDDGREVGSGGFVDGGFFGRRRATNLRERPPGAVPGVCCRIAGGTGVTLRGMALRICGFILRLLLLLYPMSSVMPEVFDFYSIDWISVGARRRGARVSGGLLQRFLSKKRSGFSGAHPAIRAWWGQRTVTNSSRQRGTSWRPHFKTGIKAQGSKRAPTRSKRESEKSAIWRYF